MLVYGDSFFHPTDSLKGIVEFHNDSRADVTIGVYQMDDYKDYGIVRLRGQDVIDIMEKASEAEAYDTKINGKFQVNSGPIVFNRIVFDYIERTKVSPSGEHWITDAIKTMIQDGRKVVGFPITSEVFWRDREDGAQDGCRTISPEGHRTAC